MLIGFGKKDEMREAPLTSDWLNWNENEMNTHEKCTNERVRKRQIAYKTVYKKMKKSQS